MALNVYCFNYLKKTFLFAHLYFRLVFFSARKSSWRLNLRLILMPEPVLIYFWPLWNGYQYFKSTESTCYSDVLERLQGLAKIRFPGACGMWKWPTAKKKVVRWWRDQSLSRLYLPRRRYCGKAGTRWYQPLNKPLNELFKKEHIEKSPPRQVKCVQM